MFAVLGFGFGLGFGAPGAAFASGWPGTFGFGGSSKVGVAKECGIMFNGFDLDLGMQMQWVMRVK